jgi:hypothetical protein
MKKELNRIAFGFIALVATVSLAQGQSEKEPENSAIPFTEKELSDFRVELDQLNQVKPVNPNHRCVVEILRNKQAKDVIKVKEDWREFIEVQSSAQDWRNVAKVCDLDQAYYDISVNAGGQAGNTQYRMRHLSYVYSSKINSKINLYSPSMSQKEMNAFISSLRSLSPGKKIEMGSILGTKSFQKLTVKNTVGKELVLTSLENRLAERARECQQTAKPNEESVCESLGYGIQLNWIYNNYISFMIYESMEDSKVDGSVDRIVAVGDSKIESIKDIRDMFSESFLLAALKQDWIVRNSNQWTRFAQAQSWDLFWNFKEKQYFGLVTEFQSYSNKLNEAQVRKVMECAKLADTNTSSNAGFACVKNKKAPTMYMFDYEVISSTLVNGFSITKMDDHAVYVRIPLMASSTGNAALSLALPRNVSDFFKVLQ